MRIRLPLSVATLLTGAVVAAGTFLQPAVSPQLLAEAPSSIERPGQVSRSQARSSLQAEVRPAASAALPPYKVQSAGKPFELKPVPVPLTYSFQVGSFNILGSNHTPKGSGYATGTTRAAWAASLIEAAGTDVVGMQEVQPDQLYVLDDHLGGYSVWPKETLGRNSYRLQIAWRDDLFELVDTTTVTTIFSTQLRPIPAVLLRHRETGDTFWFTTIHNSPRDMEGERDAATTAEISFLASLKATGHPVIVTGDMNEPTEWFCRVGAALGLTGANGATATSGCSIPGRAWIDWIAGTGVSWSGYVRNDAVNNISDHPYLHATASITTMVMRKPS